jgi:hypothetical protein
MTTETLRLHQYGKGGWSETSDRIYNAILRGKEFRSGNMTGSRVVDMEPGRLEGGALDMWRDQLPHVYVVRSYATPIAWFRNDGTWVIPDVKYTQTTTVHQRYPMVALGRMGISYEQ